MDIAGEGGRLGMDIAGEGWGSPWQAGGDGKAGVSEIHDPAFRGAMGHVPSTT